MAELLAAAAAIAATAAFVLLMWGVIAIVYKHESNRRRRAYTEAWGVHPDPDAPPGWYTVDPARFQARTFRPAPTDPHPPAPRERSARTKGRQVGGDDA